MPWKNGLGTTTEIAVHPPGAGLDAFTWRISIADLGASGPFSTFAGYDRILVQLEGAPMTLAHDGHGEHRLALLAPYRFPGEVATQATVASPARDFNLMFRRDRVRAILTVHPLDPGEVAGADGGHETRVVFLHAGAASVNTGHATIALSAGETLVLDGTDASDLTVTAAPGGATAFLISIAHAPPDEASF